MSGVVPIVSSLVEQHGSVLRNDLLRPELRNDQRGFFLESFHLRRYKKLGVEAHFVQDNHSFSKRNVLRGMHFQPGQAKLIYCPVGKIFDVAVDIRPNSPTFGRWEALILSEENHEQFFIPDGFAHGFCVLSDYAHVIYKVSDFFDPDLESGFHFKDLDIDWPVRDPILSERDKNAKRLKEL